MGGDHSRLLAYIASSTFLPYVSKQLTALFHTQPLLKYLVYSIAAPTVNCAFSVVKALQSPGHTTRLDIRPRDLGLPNRGGNQLQWVKVQSNIHKYKYPMQNTRYLRSEFLVLNIGLGKGEVEKNYSIDIYKQQVSIKGRNKLGEYQSECIGQ